VFVPGVGVPEDPATGSAAAGLGMALVASGLLPEGGRYDIVQGVEMGRPSALFGRVEASDGRATRCHVAGQVQPVASGEIAVP
jgi:trans-2,3-dihydro-3-hydroxyanthranilate isomerase